MMIRRTKNSPTPLESLRGKYKEGIEKIFEFVFTAKGPYLERENLPGNLVSFTEFDPQDSQYLSSEMCLFQPMPQETLQKYPVDRRGLAPGELDIDLEDFEPMDNPTTWKEKAMQQPYQQVIQVKQCLDILFIDLPRKRLRGGTLQEKSGWELVSSNHPFLTRLGLLANPGVLGWDAQIWEYVSKDKKRTTFPHIMLITEHESNGREDKLLLGDLATIVQAIANRLEQTEFMDTSFFPVLSLSLFGPRHGRILQGCFDNSGKLHIQATKRFSFLRRAEAPLDLFLRFLTSKPSENPNVRAFFDPKNPGA